MAYYQDPDLDVSLGSTEQSEDFVDNEPALNGYDEVFDPLVNSDYVCRICSMCLRDPVLTTCGHRFCKSCLQHHMRVKGPECPNDKQRLESSDVFPDNFAKRKIFLFAVCCRTLKVGTGCPWKGELLSIEDHLASCKFVAVLCPKGCDQMVERRALDNHIKKECSTRMQTCPHCKTDVQQGNYKEHLERCQKVPTDNRGPPESQRFCEFKPCGCKWVGEHSCYPAHLQSDLSAHVSLLRAAMFDFCPSGRVRSRGATSKLREINRKLTKIEETINEMEDPMEQIKKKFQEMNARMEQQQVECDTADESTRNYIAELEGRNCNGVYLWRITDYARHVENARRGVSYLVHSPPIYTSFYGYKLGLRLYPYATWTGDTPHVSLFVHMMKSEWDNTLEWPFTGRISLSILDQSDDEEQKVHISKTFTTPRNLLAFGQPRTARSRNGYGYDKFASLEILQGRQHVKNNSLLLRVQVQWLYIE